MCLKLIGTKFRVAHRGLSRRAIREKGKALNRNVLGRWPDADRSAAQHGKNERALLFFEGDGGELLKYLIYAHPELPFWIILPEPRHVCVIANMIADSIFVG
jgi:hypothetical protein